MRMATVDSFIADLALTPRCKRLLKIATGTQLRYGMS